MKFPVFSLIVLLIFKFPVFSLILNKIFKFPDFSLQGIFFSHFPLSVGTLKNVKRYSPKEYSHRFWKRSEHWLPSYRCWRTDRATTRHGNRSYQNENRSTGSVGKLNIMDLIPHCMPSLELQTREWAPNCMHRFQDIKPNRSKLDFSGLEKWPVWFYWMFYDHLSARSLLAKLGRWGWWWAWWGWLERKARRH